MGGLGDYGKYASLGISIVLTTAVYFFLGFKAGTWLDETWDTEPIFLIIGIVLALIMSIVTLVKELMAFATVQNVAGDTHDVENNERDRENNNFPKGQPPPNKALPTGEDENCN